MAHRFLPHLVLALIALGASPVRAEPDANTTEGAAGGGAGEVVTPLGGEGAAPPGHQDELAPLPLEQLRTFVEVFDRIRSTYVEDISDTALLEHAIEGMLDGLDPHSAYLTGQAYQDLQEATTGEFGGIGIEVGFEDGLIEVIAPIDGTPAARAGIRAGDTIVRLDGEPVKGLRLNEAIDAIRGEPQTDIELTIMRAGTSEPVELTVTRATIEAHSVSARMLEPGYAYVRIAQFQSHTGEELPTALVELRDQAGGALDGVVLDLRNNPGGVLQASVDVADAFLDDGRIVYTEGRLESAQLSFNATPDDLIQGTPLAVLINEGTASASEIVAGALQAHGRAVIMGTHSFGKGSVQTVLPLSQEEAIKLTTALYYTPDGKSIQAHGIQPDIRVRRARIERSEQRQRFTEADLPGHLPSAGEAAEATQGSEGGPAATGGAFSGSEDYQLVQAVNLLKGLNIVRRQ